jgi:hypothetical protein
MAKYRIENRLSGADIGEYEAETGRDAVEAMARDAGYPSFAAACEATGGDADEALAELRVEEVAP